MAFFVKSPRKTKGNIYSVRNVIDQIQQFHLEHEISETQSSVNSCGDDNKAANWRKYVREQTINAAGTPVELDFFEKIAGGKTEKIPTKEMYFRQNVDYDRNIYSANSVTATGPNQPATFQLLRSNHSVDGRESFPAVGFELFIYEDKQWVRVTVADVDNDYAHAFTVRPKNPAYTINIRAGKKMLVSPAVQVGGYTSNNSHAGENKTPGYIYKMTMLRLRVQWKQVVDLQKGYKDQMVFGIMFDNEGNEIDCWEYYRKVIAMEDLKYAFNLQMFLGQKLQNTDISSTLSDDSYPGFDGYHQQVKNGGGIVYPYDTQVGLDPYADFGSLMLRQDSLKRRTEFVVLRSLPFQMQFDRNFSKVITGEPGALMFNTFKAIPNGGNDQVQIRRMGINSIALWNLTMHFKNFDALSDARSIGNGDMPLHAYVMPSAGLKDDSGREVGPIETFVNEGCAETGEFEEHTYDARKEESGKEEIGGWMAKTLGFVVHGIQDHILFEPRKRC